DGEADADAAAGDERDLALKTKLHSVLRSYLLLGSRWSWRPASRRGKQGAQRPIEVAESLEARRQHGGPGGHGRDRIEERRRRAARGDLRTRIGRRDGESRRAEGGPALAAGMAFQRQIQGACQQFRPEAAARAPADE